jgi:hypothetical protein
MGLRQFLSLKTKRTSQTALHVFHQNIRGFKHKMDELMCMLDSCNLSPHIICLSEYYLIDHKHLMIKPNNYYLASRFSRQSYSGGVVCMYIKSYLESSMIDLSQYCIKKVIEVCAAQIHIGNHFIILLCIYRSSGNFGEFAVRFDLVLKYLYRPKYNLLFMVTLM